MSTYQSIHSGAFIDEQISAVSQKLPIDGVAASASKLNITDVGNSSTPVYFVNGVPVICEDISALPEGGTTGQIIVKNSDTEGDATWQDFPELNYLPLSGGYMTGSVKNVTGYYTNDNLDELWNHGGIEIRENGLVGNTQITAGYAPTLGFNWSGIAAASLSLYTDGAMYLYNNTGNLGTFKAGQVHGAVYNDYAEFRICKDNFKPGQVVSENGDDTLSIVNQRLQRGCSIISDTFGFAIGETNEAKCPLAVSGRVLAYGYESREEFKKHIGWPVCSGPNGTVSIMTEEEEEKYPSRIIGTVSAVPDYEIWGNDNIVVNNRIWIKIK